MATHFDKGRKYKFFPRTAEAETFYLTGEGLGVKNWSGDCRIRRVKRHSKYDEMWCQFGYFQKKKWLIVIFKHLRVIFSTLKPNDMLHMTGTVDRWGKRRVYVVTGIIKYPHPTITELDNNDIDMDLYKAQTKTPDEVELEQFIDFRVKDITKYQTVVGKEDDDIDATNNEIFLPENDD
jgi:hypothetical protein